MTRIHKRAVQKAINDPHNHLQPDILECEVKWALRSITTNKASGSEGIPAELFKILEDDVDRALHSIYQQIWKTQQWPQDWKKSVFIPIPKKLNEKNVQTLHSFHTLVRLCSKSFNLGFSSMWTENFQMYKLGFEKTEKQVIKCQHSLDLRKSKGIPEKHLLLLHWLH